MFKKFTFLLCLIFAVLLVETASGKPTAAVIQPSFTIPAAKPVTVPLLRESASTLRTTIKSNQEYNASRLAYLPITLRPGTEHRPDSSPTPAGELKCKSTVYQTLVSLPATHRAQLKELTLFYTSDGRRGLGGNNSIVLRCMNVSSTEVAGVLTHEIGHLVDDTLLTGYGEKSKIMDFESAVSLNDPSYQFYQICWMTEKQRKASTSPLDFVSGYAMTDPFEDFSETYAYYRLHGSEFKSVMKTSQLLRLKYEFMRDVVFSGEEFLLENPLPKEKIYSRNYDVTILPFTLKKVLG